MSPERIPEVRIARRVLLVLYLLGTLWLCLGTTLSILWALTHGDEESDIAPPATAVRGRDAIADLSTLFQELRQRGETVGGGSPRQLVDLQQWEAWTVRWHQRLERLGSRYGLTRPEPAQSEVGRSLQRVYRSMSSLLDAYKEAVNGLANARRGAIEAVEVELREAAKALRSARIAR